MLRYETLFLARTELTADEASMIERHLDELISGAKGKLDSFDKWGKFRLAYPIEKNTHGIYILSRFSLPAESVTKVLKDLETFLKIRCNEIVMRSVTVKLKPNAPTVYQRPEATDVTRSGSLDALLKDNKIENLLSSVSPTAQPHQGVVVEDDDVDPEAEA